MNCVNIMLPNSSESMRRLMIVCTASGIKMVCPIDRSLFPYSNNSAFRGWNSENPFDHSPFRLLLCGLKYRSRGLLARGDPCFCSCNSIPCSSESFIK